MPAGGSVRPERCASPLKSICAKIVRPRSRADAWTRCSTSATLCEVGSIFSPSTAAVSLMASLVSLHGRP